MHAPDRHAQIARVLESNGFMSITELSDLFQVSEMTIRRDLVEMEKQRRILRVYKGAVPINSEPRQETTPSKVNESTGLLIDQVDVLIATAMNPEYDGQLLELIQRRDVPIVAESVRMGNERTLVSPDLHQAGLELGDWAAQYACDHWNGQANLLALTYYIPNTVEASNSFVEGLQSRLPGAEVVLRVNVVLTNQNENDETLAYQLVRDALTIHPKINMILAINDLIAGAAVRACRDLNKQPGDVIVLAYGLEGNTLIDLLAQDAYLKAVIAMFPDVVATACFHAAIAAFAGCDLPANTRTPYALVTPDNLPDFYQRQKIGWQMIPAVRQQLEENLGSVIALKGQVKKLPERIGFLVPFSNHEWYINLLRSMRLVAGQHQVQIDIVDVDQSLQSEINHRRREIARLALQQIEPEDVILVDDGPVTRYLVEMMPSDRRVTVITNSQAILDLLKENVGVTLISTGGAYRRASQAFVGPTAENALKEFRADKLFLTADGLSLSFGLSHTNVSEVTIKQAMIRSAKEVILLADYTTFGEDSVVQVAPVSVIDKLITDDTLPASYRLELSRSGVKILLAKV